MNESINQSTNESTNERADGWMDGCIQGLRILPERLAYPLPRYANALCPISSTYPSLSFESCVRDFVCVRAYHLPGVLYACSGYTGGSVDSPTYNDICTGDSGHAEAVQVIFDPAEVSYETILEAFMKHHDPTQLNRQVAKRERGSTL